MPSKKSKNYAYILEDHADEIHSLPHVKKNNLFVDHEKNTYLHKCTNCKMKFCTHEIKRRCPFCDSPALIITKPKEA